MASARTDGDGAPERKRARPFVADHGGSKWTWTNNSSSNQTTTRAIASASPSAGSDSLSLSGSDTCGSQKTSPASTPVAPAAPSANLRVTLPTKVISLGGGSGSGGGGRDSDSPSLSALVGGGCGPASALNTPPVISSIHGDLRPFLLKPAVLSIDEHHHNHNHHGHHHHHHTGGDGSGGSGVITSSSSSTAASNNTIGVVAPWHMQDFPDGLAFDASLSGLSDLAAPGCMNDVMEFVKRQSSHPGNNCGENFVFQYILMAPTSAAVKSHEEPLTYMNQGQSYEIKCKKLGADGMIPGRLFRSIIRVTFHDRRQKFQEKELLNQWKLMHLGDKIIDADIPMSFNVFNVKTDPMGNWIEFLWDPTKNTSIFIKVNCISTEFTQRKHGGEKGVPFRLQIDTYLYGDEQGDMKQLHSSYAQVKVFKTKGADRKNKTDREKAERHADKEKYQPSYDYTILTETFPLDTYDEFGHHQQHPEPSPDEVIISEDHHQHPAVTPKALVAPMSTASSGSSNSNNNNNIGAVTGVKQTNNNNNTGSVNLSDVEMAGVDNFPIARSPSPSSEERQQRSATLEILHADATPSETITWLRRHRFNNYLKTFGNFSGADLLRLSREDLIQICGTTADGIRLFNALQQKKVQPKLTLYMCVPGAPAYHVVFLIALTLQELLRKVCDLIEVQPSQVFDVYCQGPEGINVHMNDDVVQNLPDRSRYVIDAMKCGDEQSERYRILLKAATEN